MNTTTYLQPLSAYFPIRSPLSSCVGLLIELQCGTVIGLVHSVFLPPMGMDPTVNLYPILKLILFFQETSTNYFSSLAFPILISILVLWTKPVWFSTFLQKENPVLSSLIEMAMVTPLTKMYDSISFEK